MNLRNIITVLAVMLCAAGICALLIQRQTLNLLRADQQAAPAPQRDSPDDTTARAPAQNVSPELLRLRSQVTQLQARERQLAGVQAESERLRVQLAGVASNAGSGYVLPPGYLRKSQANYVGYATPENTIQSFLWALRNNDLTNVLVALTPEAAARLQAEIARSGRGPEEFFKATEAIPGMAIQAPRTEGDGSVRVHVEVLPAGTNAAGANTHSEDFRLRSINGEWKLDLPF